MPSALSGAGMCRGIPPIPHGVGALSSRCRVRSSCSFPGQVPRMAVVRRRCGSPSTPWMQEPEAPFLLCPGERKWFAQAAQVPAVVLWFRAFRWSRVAHAPVAERRLKEAKSLSFCFGSKGGGSSPHGVKSLVRGEESPVPRQRLPCAGTDRAVRILGDPAGMSPSGAGGSTGSRGHS